MEAPLLVVRPASASGWVTPEDVKSNMKREVEFLRRCVKAQKMLPGGIVRNPVILVHESFTDRVHREVQALSQELGVNKIHKIPARGADSERAWKTVRSFFTKYDAVIVVVGNELGSEITAHRILEETGTWRRVSIPVGTSLLSHDGQLIQGRNGT